MSQHTDRFDPEWASASEHALVLHELGLQPVPALRPKKGEQWKRPSIEWKPLSLVHMTYEQALGYFGEGGSHKHVINIGILTGQACAVQVNGVAYKVVVIDMDTYKSDKPGVWWRGLLDVHNNGMDLETVEQKTGGGGRQLLFLVPLEWHAPTCKFPELGVDIRGDGGFIVCAPSHHESGNRYQWVEGYAPWEFEIAVAPQWLLDEIDRLVALYGGRGSQAGSAGPRERLDAPKQRSLGGFLLDGREQLMQDMVWAQCVDLRVEFDKPGDFQEIKAGLYDRYFWQVKSRIPGVPTEEGLEREGRGKTEFDRKWDYAMAQWDTGLKHAANERPRPQRVVMIHKDEDGVEHEVDPETGEFIEEQPKKADNDEWDGGAPKLTLIPSVYDPWEERIVPDFPFDALPVKLSHAIRLKALSTGGCVSAMALACLVALGACLDGQFRIKMKRTGHWTMPLRLWGLIIAPPSGKKTPIMSEALAPLLRIENEAYKKYARELERHRALPKDEQGDEPPLPPRYTTHSATPEKIADILSRQNRGILQIADEMSGFLASMDQYKSSKGGADKAFYAQAYNGGSYRYDRVMKGEKHIENLLMSMLGGIQPDMLAKIADFSDNGLMQRFLVVMASPSEMSQEIADEIGLQYYDDMCNRMASYKPVTLQPTPEALTEFQAFEKRMHELMRYGGLPSALESFIGKLAGLQGSLAGILHMIEDGWDQPIPGRVAKNAARLLEEFFIPHALAFYDGFIDSAIADETKMIASHILTSTSDRLRPADLTRSYRSFRGLGMQDLARRIDPLVAGGWLEPEYEKGSPGIKAWRVVEGLREAMADRVMIEKVRRAEVRKTLMGLKNQAKNRRSAEEDQ